MEHTHTHLYTMGQGGYPQGARETSRRADEQTQKWYFTVVRLDSVLLQKKKTEPTRHPLFFLQMKNIM